MAHTAFRGNALVGMKDWTSEWKRPFSSQDLEKETEATV